MTKKTPKKKTTKKASKTAAKPKPKAEKKANKPKTAPVSKGNITKTLAIMTALESKNGITIEDLMKITGWQAHSVRGFLSTQKKKDINIEKFEREDGKKAYKLEISKNNKE